AFHVTGVQTCALPILARILGNIEDENVRVVMAENYVSFSVGLIQLLSRLIDGQYPDYRQVIPTSYRSRIARLESAVLAQAVERRSEERRVGKGGWRRR